MLFQSYAIAYITKTEDKINIKTQYIKKQKYKQIKTRFANIFLLMAEACTDSESWLLCRILHNTGVGQVFLFFWILEGSQKVLMLESFNAINLCVSVCGSLVLVLQRSRFPSCLFWLLAYLMADQPHKCISLSDVT